MKTIRSWKVKKFLSVAFLSFCLLYLQTPERGLAAPLRIWTIQIGSFSERENVNKAIRDLRGKGMRNVWVQMDNGAYATRIGRFSHKNEATAVYKRILKTYPQAILKSVIEEPGRSIYSKMNSPPTNKRAVKRQDVGIISSKLKNVPAEKKSAGNVLTDGKKKEITIANPDFVKAVDLYDRGDFPGAAALFQQIMRQTPADPIMYEQAFRKLADCCLSIGRNGSNPHLLAAVDHYKSILRNYPDPREGNELVYVNLARSYEGLKFYYEAAAKWQNLLSKYPESPQGEEALFRLAELLSEVRRYEQALERHRQYIEKYPHGVHIRSVVVGLADAYYHMNDFDNAAKLYEDIAKENMHITNIPKETLYRIGATAYHKERFAEAIRMLSAYISLYPDGKTVKMGLYLLGCSFHRLERFNTAIQVFNEIIDKYPDSAEAQECILKIANLGVQNAGLRIPVYLSAINYYRDPLDTYDTLLKSHPAKDFDERVRYAKAEALFRKDRYPEAIGEYLLLQEQYPQGMYLSHARSQLKTAVLKLLDSCYARGDHVAIAALYCRTFGRIAFGREDLDGLMKMADSLHKISLDTEARRILNYAGTISPDSRMQSRIAIFMETLRHPVRTADSGSSAAQVSDVPNELTRAALDDLEKSLAKASNGQRRWLLFTIGRRLAATKEWPAAEKRFLQIKDGSTDPFWTKLSDYAVQDARWLYKYSDFY